jgi:hypothetical protein
MQTEQGTYLTVASEAGSPPNRLENKSYVPDECSILSN